MPKKPSSFRTGASHAARVVWITVGLMALVLGFIGIFLPLLPTTPLVLLAAFAFAKGSPRLRKMLDDHRIFGPIIADWEQNGAIARRYKVVACTAMLAVFSLSLLAGVPAMVIGIQAVCLGAAAIFVLSRPDH